MDIYEERKQAISLYETGKKIRHIVGIFKKSRQWFYFWLKRYQLQDGQGEWFKGESKAPELNQLRLARISKNKLFLPESNLKSKDTHKRVLLLFNIPCTV
jgi:transposase